MLFRTLASRCSSGVASALPRRFFATQIEDDAVKAAALKRNNRILALALGAAALTTGGLFYANYFSQRDAKKQQEEKRKQRLLAEPVPALNADAFTPFKLKEVIPINYNTSTFRFELPEGTTELGLPVASAVVTKFVRGTKPDGKPDTVIRLYTPIETPGAETFDLVVKKYTNGPMSTHIFNLKPGDSLDLKGPIKKFEYKANQFEKIGLIAGGTGLTPMIQLIQKVINNPEDKTKLSLVFANVSETDIIFRSYLDSLAAAYPEKLSVYYVLDRPPAKWNGGSGYINTDHIKAHMPAPGAGKVFICGPNPMLAHLSGIKAPDYTQGPISGLLKDLGYTEADVFKF
ncbi:uncharacterized protein BJ171DRAFT_515174 [Polychytrium aggregatum]|uniref:uncharacterized protein n=1 Tax=Polychytrium aggregatum TaxID=110093 RepID=UPI0022FE6005|nr:uncharacterized protein BJ171DRAFT_515174 [Polychytrium aggregatum]KAI9202198.1 hypothetical protein BJ171DRAFT_515174 [Polychytrium aggregatum]